MAIVVVLA
jgi:hypothetical protein